MAKITVEEQKEFALFPPDSILHLKVDELDIKKIDGKHGPWEKLEIKFKILGIVAIGDGGSPDDYEENIAGPIWGSVPFRLTDSPENKLRQWAEAILNIELGVGFELDTDLFLNREVRGITSQYPKRAINKETGQPFMGHQIDALLPKAGAQPVSSQAWHQPTTSLAGNAAQPAAWTPQDDPWATQPAASGPPATPWPGDDEPPF